jgi:hypothetical protein
MRELKARLEVLQGLLARAELSWQDSRIQIFERDLLLAVVSAFGEGSALYSHHPSQCLLDLGKSLELSHSGTLEAISPGYTQDEANGYLKRSMENAHHL